MEIATWNINGIKARLENLLIWLGQNRPDIICLQETKSLDEKFPRTPFENLGYHVETHGQKGFNGVALLSRMVPEKIIRNLPGDADDNQARYIEGVYPTIRGLIRIASLYLPNGNPIESDKYFYKLAWMKRLHSFAEERLLSEEPFVLAGDYNVIPTKRDARNIDKWRNDAMFLPQVREAFRNLISLGFTDAFRAVSNKEHSYSFWNYRGSSWRKDDGIRIDHLLLSPEATDTLSCAFIQKEIRGWNKPSDHVPVWAVLDF